MADPDGDDRAEPAPPGVRRHPVPSLLTSLLASPVDPGYVEAAARRAAGGERPPSRPRRYAWLMVGVAVIGLLLGVAVRVTESNAAGADSARLNLLADVDRAQLRAGGLESSAAQLAARIRSSQAALGGIGPLAEMSRLEQAGARTPVTGPGLALVIDPGTDGTILDRDIQVLVNGLWAAGAEAIAIGGVRLQGTSAIRQAGGAILVDNRPVFWPISIDAIGNPATLHADFATTAGYGRFTSFVQLYSIRFEVTDVPSLTLPAAIPRDLRFATAPPTGTAPATDIAPPTRTATAAPTTR